MKLPVLYKQGFLPIRKGSNNCTNIFFAVPQINSAVS